MLIHIQHIRSMQMRIRIQGFDDQKFTKIYSWKNQFFFVQKLQFTYPETFIKDVQATGEPFSLKRWHPALQNKKFLNFFHFFGSLLPSWIRIQPTKINADVDTKHWTKHFIFYVFAIIHIVRYLFANGIQKSGPVAFTVCRRLLIPSSSTAHDIIRSIRLFVRKIFQENRIQS